MEINLWGTFLLMSHEKEIFELDTTFFENYTTIFNRVIWSCRKISFKCDLSIVGLSDINNGRKRYSSILRISKTKYLPTNVHWNVFTQNMTNENLESWTVLRKHPLYNFRAYKLFPVSKLLIENIYLLYFNINEVHIEKNVLMIIVFFKNWIRFLVLTTIPSLHKVSKIIWHCLNANSWHYSKRNQ